MVEQSDFPSLWSCNSQEKRVRVEVRVPNVSPAELAKDVADMDFSTLDRYTWIEIPTTSVEQWVEKGDASALQRTAKIEFPTEWGDNGGDVAHNSPRKLITTSQEDIEYTLARVWFQSDDGEWFLTHLGWIGGVGSASRDGLSKLWVYDFAEMLSSVPVGITFNNPSVQQALATLVQLTNDNTPIPISEARYIPPNAEELQGFTRRPEFTADTPLGQGVYESNNVLSESYNVYETMNSAGPGQLTVEELQEFLTEDLGGGVQPESTISTQSGGERIIPDRQELGEIGGQLRDGDVGGALSNALTVDEGSSTTTFEENHDTLLDVYDWLEQKIDGKLHFEPLHDSVALVADIGTSRRVFAQEEVVDNYEGEDIASFSSPNLNFDFEIDVDLDYSWQNEVTVTNNDALFEMKPLNTLELRGSMSFAVDDVEREEIEIGPDKQIEYEYVDQFDIGKQYPVVKVQVPSLIEAAEGVELSPEVVESDVGELDEAEREARKELANLLEETTEGSVELLGEPQIVPFDRIDSYEVCNSRVQFEQLPVSYEVESVKHVKTAEDEYKTVLDVSIWANEKNMETVRKEMVGGITVTRDQ